MPSNLKVHIHAELRAPNGNLLKRLPWVKANSLLKQFMQILAVQMDTAARTIKDTVGTDRNVTANVYAFQLSLVAGQTDRGIVIGTNATAVTMADNKLAAQVTANVTHSAGTVALENPDASTWRVSIERVFTNNTAGTLQIREVGLYTMESATPYYFCIDRTLYSVDVPVGIQVTLTYRITITL
jgi:hypothetical protein